ncbi:MULTISPECIES: chemotaxis protein CheB [Aerosakkonema]|uniref:chemotaxis protein CheB n=1 Tax=Aerosakkonema TaxID=1246629 RepID=UPI0035B83CC6
MPTRDIIVIGASAGGVEALINLAADLPLDISAAIFVVVHFPSYSKSVLPQILNRAGPLKAEHAKDGQAIERGHIYVAPPDWHLIVKREHIHLSRGPRENNHRPAIDTLFRSAAIAYGRRVIGVVLTGTLDDGTAGLLAVKQRGGLAIVQDPNHALFGEMPRSAIENVEIDCILPLSEIAGVLVKLARELVVEEADRVSNSMEVESALAQMDMKTLQSDGRPGTPSAFACPECGGVLWELKDGKYVRFRCRTGHAFSPKSLLASQSEALEEALWSALRALEEKSALIRRMAERAKERNQKLSAQRFEAQAKDADQSIALIREALIRNDSNNNGEEETKASEIDRLLDDPKEELESDRHN